ncbi:MAG: sigma-70 family RNA polymerase sigma factor [Psychroflexus maritimus]
MKEVEKISDFDIIQRIVKGNEKHLFSVIYDRYAKLIYNRCYGFASTNSEAKDLTQDVFIKAYLKLGTFTENISFKSWLYTLAYRFCVNYVNRNKEKKIEQFSKEIDEVNELDFTEDNEDIFSMEVERLKKSLDLISPENKMILLLKYQDDVSIKELALSLEIGESAVKMRLKRAKARLSEVYKTTV